MKTMLSRRTPVATSRGQHAHALSVPHDASFLAINQHVPDVGLKHCAQLKGLDAKMLCFAQHKDLRTVHSMAPHHG